MSLSARVFRDWWDDFERPSKLLDRHFGTALTSEELLRILPMPPLTEPFINHLSPWANLLQQNNTVEKVQNDKDKFRVTIEVQNYQPEEIVVKTVDKLIIVEGKHEEKKDEHGYVAKKFVRRYVLPDSHDIDKVTSNLSSNGILTIEAPKLAVTES